MPALPHFAAALLRDPWLVDCDYANLVLATLGERLEIETREGATTPTNYVRPARDLVFDQHRGIAVVPIVGAMVHRGDSMNPMSGSTSYTAVQRTLTEVAGFRGIRGIVLDMDTPGGQVAGVTETGEFLRRLAAEIPVYVVANSLMASAGYWLGATATRIYASPLSMIGSIGVVVAHTDTTEAEKKRGVVTTYIAAGAKKTEGSGPLTDAAMASIRARIDGIYDKFVAHVATSRGLDPAAVRATEAGVFSPEQAVDLGLADGTATLPEVLDALSTRLSTHVFGGTAFASTPHAQETPMTERTTLSQADLDGAVARAVADTTSASLATHTGVLATARAALVGEMATAIAGLVPGNARLEGFFAALSEGTSVTLAAKLANMVPLAAAPVASVAGVNRDVARVFAASAPNVDGGTGPVDADAMRALRITELRAAGARASAAPFTPTR